MVGHRDVPGKPALFGTTRAFLDYFDLTSLDDLPTLAEIRDMANLEPEFDFDSAQDANNDAGGSSAGEDSSDEPLDAQNAAVVDNESLESADSQSHGSEESDSNQSPEFDDFPGSELSEEEYERSR